MKRFWDKVDIKGIDDCWNWLHGGDQGYGHFRFNGKHSEKSQRVAWILTFGPIPEGLFVLHRCDNRACCNPKHLFLGTNLDNVLDMCQKGRHAKEQSNSINGRIRALYSEPLAAYTQEELALKCNCTHRAISKAIFNMRTPQYATTSGLLLLVKDSAGKYRVI